MSIFITFEGIDGSGKSTISQKVYENLKKDKYKVRLTFEPTDTTIGRFVHQCIKIKSDPYVIAFSFIADRIQHCQQIQRWLDEEYIVLCDRYAESTYAYQGAQLEDALPNPMKWLQEMSQQKIIIPTRTYLFQLPVQQALDRIQHRNELIPFEQLVFLEKVQQNYLALSQGKQFTLIDATKKIEDLFEICYNDIMNLIS